MGEDRWKGLPPSTKEALNQMHKRRRLSGTLSLAVVSDSSQLVWRFLRSLVVVDDDSSMYNAKEES